jgi:hypothetical protein
LSRSLGTVGMSKPSLTCFVIGPIGDEHAPIGSPDRTRYEKSLEVWERIVEPACLGQDLNPIRADKVARVGEITEQVFTLIRDADLVIADVTGGNPNVMYELGLRHTVDKRTIQIGEYGQLPFDIAAIRTLLFTRTPAGLVDGRKKLENAVEASLRGEFDPVTATRVWRGLPAAPVEQIRVSKDSGEDADDPGTMELLAEMESAIPALGVLLEESTVISRRVAAAADSSTLEIQQSDANNGGFAGRLLVANRLAGAMASAADEFEAIAGKFEERTQVVSAGINCLIEAIDADPSALFGLRPFRLAAKEFMEVARSVVSTQGTLAATFKKAGKASRPLRAASKRIVGATRRIGHGLMASENWVSRLDELYRRHGVMPEGDEK